MKLGKGVPSVWPGYVAAVASLVLSLLLLLAILVFAMTQVENMVARYEQEILRAQLLAQAQQEVTPQGGAGGQPTPARVAPLPAAQVPQAAPAKGVAADHDQLRLIFESGVADISRATVNEIGATVQQLRGYQEMKWLISASTLESDPVMEKTTYRLMLLVRKVLREQHIDEKNIELKLKKTTQPPPGYEQGEIVIHAALSNAAVPLGGAR